MKSKDLTFGISNPLKSNGAKKGGRLRRTRRRWRVEIVNENTLTRVWSVRLSGVRVWVATAAVVAAVASLIAVIFLFTPLAGLLPGRLSGDMRSRYLDAAVRLDSLERVARSQAAYTENIMAIFTDSVKTQTPAPAAAEAPADTLLEATEAEREFVRRFEERERFNLSVLSPIAAEGMIFDAPVQTADGPGPVAAVYRGTVVGLEHTEGGTYTVTVQHPNDFLSVYSRLDDVYVDKGAKVLASQRLGRTTGEAAAVFELWHSGTKLDPTLYIPESTIKK